MVNDVVEALTAGQALSLTSNQTYEITEYKPELLFTMLLLTREEQTTDRTIHSS